MPCPRLLLAHVASLLLHLAVLGATDLMARPVPPPRPTPAMLEARLLPPAPPAEPLLKNTLEAEEEAAAPPPRPAAQQPAGPRPARAATAAAQRKLAEHLFYPEEARRQGLEGEVRLLLTLDAAGGVQDAQVAGSSGHALLDQAAVRAAYAMGSLAGSGRREIILPVVFRLAP